MSVKDKTYWEVCIQINPICADILCDIIQTEFECEGIITAEEKYKNLELVESTENILKAYIVADVLDFDEVKNFIKLKREELVEKNIFNCDIGSWDVTIKKQEIEDWSKKWKEYWKVIVGNILLVVFQLVSMYVKNIKLGILGDNNLIGLIFSLDILIMIMLYYGYSNLIKINKNKKKECEQDG